MPARSGTSAQSHARRFDARSRRFASFLRTLTVKLKQFHVFVLDVTSIKLGGDETQNSNRKIIHSDVYAKYEAANLDQL